MWKNSGIGNYHLKIPSTKIPYYSRNLSIDALTRYITSLKVTLNNANESWVNEFLSKRHDGLDALETVFGKLVAKKTK